MKILKKKHPFTLIEVTLAFSILSIIVVFLLSTFRSSITLSLKVDKARHLLLSRHHVMERLSQTLSRVEGCINPLIEKGESAFYTEEKLKNTSSSSLYFAFNNGIDPEEDFTGMVHGKLYIQDNMLLLEEWPMEEKKSAKRRCERLFSHVKEISFTFYKRPSLLKTTRFEGVHNWPIEESDIPYCMTLSLHLEDNTFIDYSFNLSSKIQPIHYDL